MGDAAGERPQGLEALRPAQFLLHLAEFFISMLAFGHILHETHHANRPSCGIKEHSALGL